MPVEQKAELSNGSLVYQFVRERFPNTKNVVSECNKELKRASTLRYESQQKIPWSTIGTAIDFRIRCYFPEVKLPGAASLPLAQFALHRLVVPSSWDLLNEPTRIVKLPPGVFIGSSWVPQNVTDEEVAAISETIATLQKTVDGFFKDFENELRRLKPAGRRLPHDQEDILGRYCYVMALFAANWFTWSAEPHPRQFLTYPFPKRNTAELLNLVEDAWVDDLRSLSWAFYDHGFPCELLTRPTVSNPLFDIGEGDLVVDGCLVEIKTTVQPKLKREWLYQLLSYALTDREDNYKIREVGVYFTRQQKFIRWSILDLLSTLAKSDVPSLQALRDDCANATSKELNDTSA